MAGLPPSSSPYLLLEIKCVMIKKLLLSVLAIFGFALVGVSSASAASTTYTVDSSTPTNRNICNEIQGGCSSYNYMLISYSGSSPSSSNLAILLMNSSYYFQFRPYFINSVLLPYQNLNDLKKYDFSFPSDGSITIEFNSDNPYSSGIVPSGTLNITENGTYDVTNYASAVVNIDQTISDLPPYSELVVDSFWKYHVAIAGGLASIFAVFVVYRIIKSRLR